VIASAPILVADDNLQTVWAFASAAVTRATVTVGRVEQSNHQEMWARLVAPSTGQGVTGTVFIRFETAQKIGHEVAQLSIDLSAQLLVAFGLPQLLDKTGAQKQGEGTVSSSATRDSDIVASWHCLTPPLSNSTW
jgi:hypothetical protein